jgi:hypothetical protein
VPVVVLQIALAGIANENDLRALAHPSEEGLCLVTSEVLSFIDYIEGSSMRCASFVFDRDEL